VPRKWRMNMMLVTSMARDTNHHLKKSPENILMGWFSWGRGMTTVLSTTVVAASPKPPSRYMTGTSGSAASRPKRVATKLAAWKV